MSDRKINITVKRNRKLIVHTEETTPDYDIPLPYNSTFESKYMKTREINPYIKFGRSGIIPFLRFNGEPIILLTVYKGLDRGVPVLNISDFGGRTEKGEDFLTTACWEAAEESLGLVNFIDRNNSILQESQSSYNIDLSVIVTAVPTKYNGDINELVYNYSSIKKEINGELEDNYSLPDRIINNRTIIFQEREIEKLELVNTSEDIAGKARGGSFNSNETRHIVYVTLKDIKKILKNRRCPLPYNLSCVVKDYYYYPAIYFAVANHLSNLIPYIESYNFSS